MHLSIIKANAINAVKRDGYDRIIYKTGEEWAFSKLNECCVWKDDEPKFLVKQVWRNQIAEIDLIEISVEEMSKYISN